MPKLIVELAKHHTGDLRRAKDLIDSAKENGADYVKFQAYSLADLNPKHANYERYKKCHLPISSLVDLSNHARVNQIGFFVSCFSLDFLKELRGVCDVLKVPSTFLSYKDFIYTASTMFEELHISTGMHTADEAVSLLSEYRRNLNCDIIPYHCVSEYPAKRPKLNRLYRLQHRFPIVGYSDHTEGIGACIQAYAMGVSFIEKHYDFLNEHTNKPWNLTPNTLKVLKSEFKKIDELMEGSDLSEEEVKNFNFYREEFKGLNGNTEKRIFLI